METPGKPFSVKDKVIIITGGAGMLGREYAAFLSVVGARVVLFDIVDDPKLPEGVAARYMKVDITDRDAVNAAVAEVAEEYGRIDVLVNNAAMNPKVEDPEIALQFAPYEEYPRTLWER